MRKANLLQTAIWEDSDFLNLTSDAKLVYLMLLTQKNVAPTGLLPMTTKRWASYTFAGDTARLVTTIDELGTNGFTWDDPIAEELIIRSWVKHNVLGQPKMETAARDQLYAITSKTLRSRLVSAYPSTFDTLSIPYPENQDTQYQKRATARGIEVLGTVVLGASKEEGQTRARDVWQVYAGYHPNAVFTAPRRQLVERRLREFLPSVLVAAIHGNHLDPHCNGQNQHGKQYHSLELILRDAGHIEQYAALHESPPRLNGAARSMQLAEEAYQREQEHPYAS